MDCPTKDPQSKPDDLKRRRTILARHIGEHVTLKRQHREVKHAPNVGVLVDVKRTRAVVRFGEQEPEPTFFDSLHDGNRKTPQKPVFGVFGRWTLPLDWLLLPGSTEPLPGQRELFQGVSS